MVSRKRRLARDPNTEKHLFGRVRIDKPAQRARENAASRRELNAAKRNLKNMEKVRDKYPRNSPMWRDLDRQIQRYRENNGL